jgi:hypothetical protein
VRKLTLKTEHLTELTTEELRTAVGGTFTGAVACILSIKDPCVSELPCTKDLIAQTGLCG